MAMDVLRLLKKSLPRKLQGAHARDLRDLAQRTYEFSADTYQWLKLLLDYLDDLQGESVDIEFGTTAGTACEGNDSRLSDARAPTAHHTTHESGGSDAIKLDDLAAPDDNSDLNASTSKHGLQAKAAYYVGWATPGNGTAGTWSDNTGVYTSVIGTGKPLGTGDWTDVIQTGITRSGSTWTFAKAGAYVWFSRLPANATSGYISVRLQGSGGTHFEAINFHGPDAVGEGERPWMTVIVIPSDNYDVTLQYNRSGGTAGSYSAPPNIGSSPTSVGNIAIFRMV